MKPILFAIILLSSATLHAQKFEVGMNGGVIFNTMPSINDQMPIRADFGKVKPSSLTPTGSIDIIYNFKKWQAGLAVGMEQLSYRYCPVIGPLDQPTNKYDRILLADKAYPISLFLNRTVLTFRRLQVYGGFSGGGLLVQSPAGMKGVEIWTAKENGAGFLIGAQVGGCYYISKHVGFNLQAAYQYMDFKASGYRYKLSALPFTAGIRYRL